MSTHVPSPVDLSDPNDSPVLNATQTTKASQRKAPKPRPKPKAHTKTTKTKDVAAPKASAMPKSKASDDLVVFAFRLSSDERDLIHQASGSAKASRFVRAVALAAARRDMKALQAILLEVQRPAD